MILLKNFSLFSQFNKDIIQIWEAKVKKFFKFISPKKKKIRIPIGLQTVTDRLLICILLFFLGDIINQRNPIPGGRTGSECQVLFATIVLNFLELCRPRPGLSQIRLSYLQLLHLYQKSTWQTPRGGGIIGADLWAKYFKKVLDTWYQARKIIVVLLLGGSALFYTIVVLLLWRRAPAQILHHRRTTTSARFALIANGNRNANDSHSAPCGAGGQNLVISNPPPYAKTV